MDRIDRAELYERIGVERTFEVDVIKPKLVKREIVRPKYRQRLDRNRAPMVAVGAAALRHLLQTIQGNMVDVFADRDPRKQPRRSVATPSDRCFFRPKRRRWCSIGDSPRRHGELTSLLDDFRGVLQSDGCEAHPSYVRSHAGVTWEGCWAQARRHVVEAMAEQEKAVHLVLRLIVQLHRLEAEWDQANVCDPRDALRQRETARPLRWLRRVAIARRLVQRRGKDPLASLRDVLRRLAAWMDEGRSHASDAAGMAAVIAPSGMVTSITTSAPGLRQNHHYHVGSSRQRYHGYTSPMKHPTGRIRAAGRSDPQSDLDIGAKKRPG